MVSIDGNSEEDESEEKEDDEEPKEAKEEIAFARVSPALCVTEAGGINPSPKQTYHEISSRGESCDRAVPKGVAGHESSYLHDKPTNNKSEGTGVL